MNFALMVPCGRCGTPVNVKDAETCFYCLGLLCKNCWDNFGHCGHPEADEINRKAREVVQPEV